MKYIEQLYHQRPHFITYLPIPLSFIVLMVYNFIVSSDVDSTVVIQQMIDMIGVNATFVLSVGPLAVGLLIVLFWSKFIQNISITKLTTSRISIDWKRFFFSFLLWGGTSLVLTLLSYFASPEDFVWNFKPVPFFIFLVLALLFIPLQTSFEEYLFRAHMMQGIGLATKNRLIPLIVTSVLFGVMHIANPEVSKIGGVIMIFYIGTGFFLGIITLMDEGLELALGFHAANNLITALLVTSDWSAFQTHSIFKDVSEPSNSMDVLIPVFVIYPILLFIYAKKYKWSHWKERLMGNIVIEQNN